MKAKGRSEWIVTTLKAPEIQLRAGEPRVSESRGMCQLRALGQQADNGAAWEHPPGTPVPAAPGWPAPSVEAGPEPLRWGRIGGCATAELLEDFRNRVLCPGVFVPAWVLRGPPGTSGNLMFSKLYFYAQQALRLPG